MSNAFSEGLFLGIRLFHVLLKNTEMIEDLNNIPITYFFAFLSFALILFVEKVAFNIQSLLHGHGYENKNE